MNRILLFQSVSESVDIPLGVEPQTAAPVMHNSPVPVPVVGAPLTPEQRAKLQSELDVVQGNMAVLGEMLSEIVPGKEQLGDLELLHVSHRCHRCLYYVK